MEAQLEELGSDTVRLTVDVPAHDVHHAVEHATSDLASSVKIPGFRPGKVPTPILLQRLGKERIYAEAVDSHISGWFWNAAARARIRPVGQPEFEYELPTDDDAAWQFKATVPVQPKVEVVDWTGLEVGRPEAEVPEELVVQELEALRESVAELVPPRTGPHRRATRSWSTSSRRPAKPSATRLSSSAPAGSSRRSRPRSSAPRRGRRRPFPTSLRTTRPRRSRSP